MKILILLFVILLSGCASEGRTLLDRLEFEGDEVGCFRATGVVDTNTSPFFTANVTVNLVKQKGDGPDC